MDPAARIGADGWPIHERGVVPSAPGLYFMGLPFQYAFISPLIGGVGRDARYVVDRLMARSGARGAFASGGPALVAPERE